MTKYSSFAFVFCTAICISSGNGLIAGKKCHTCETDTPVAAIAPQQAHAVNVDRPVPHPMASPPGTLGRTYYRATRMVPAYKHPRVGILDVHVANAATVQVYHTSPFREEDLLDGFQDYRNENLWRFESKPLIPGIPQIYRVEAVDSIGQRKVRYVRLIAGRVVDLDFSCEPNCRK